jgi:hypothetical protein
MMPQTKEAYKVTVRIVNLRAGDYRVLSSDGATWYAVNVAHTTCTCKAGQNSFRGCKRMPYCKHVAGAKLVAKMHHDREQASRQAVIAQSHTSAAAFMELYG